MKLIIKPVHPPLMATDAGLVCDLLQPGPIMGHGNVTVKITVTANQEERVTKQRENKAQ